MDESQVIDEAYARHKQMELDLAIYRDNISVALSALKEIRDGGCGILIARDIADDAIATIESY